MNIATISVRPMRRRLAVKELRQVAEPVAALLAFSVIVWFSPWLASKFTSGGWSASGLYTGVFSWASIQTGFLFAIYTFIVPRAEPFVRAVAATKAFAAFKVHMLRTTYLTLAVAIPAFALTVVNPAPPATGIGSLAMAAWLALFLYSVLCFLKIIRSFRKLERTRR